MIAFFKLIRVQNLLIIAILQYFVRWFIIYPVLDDFGLEFQLSELVFASLVMATVMLTAAGYVINDYFDRPTDLVNRPDTVIVGKSLNRRVAIILHIVFNVLGVAFGSYVSYKSGFFELSMIYIVVTGLLWYYSTTYKRQLLIGNIIVAFLTAAVPLLVAIYEVPQLNLTYADILEEGASFNYLFYYTLIVAYFAFLMTLIREIVKDIEDLEGDNAFDRNTLPVVIGVKNTKIVVIALIVFTISSLIFIYHTYLEYLVYIEPIYTLMYFIIGISLPLLVLIWVVLRADSKKQYHLASNFTKIIMLVGILYLVYRELINKLIES
ncbi:MAG: prenyltransferase [Marinilabiliales bacterium]|nr:MAG: prenyltransferase [Marinilabiliales bacterium]